MASKSNKQSFVIHEISDKSAFPNFSKPEILGCFSLDSNRVYKEGPEFLKFCKAFQNKEKKVKFDLDDNCVEGSIEDEEAQLKETSELVHLLHWINTHSSLFQQLRPHFVLYRGLMSKILGTPYEERESWTVAAMHKNGTTYLRNIETAESILSREQYNSQPRLRKMAAWGHKFESYLLADEPGGKPNPEDTTKKECNVVYRTKLNDHKILYAAELDGVWWESGSDINPKLNPEKLSKCKLIELKTTRHFPYEEMPTNFRKFSLRKWWIQSFTAGISDIVVGFRDDEGFVNKLQVMPLHELPKSGVGWSGNVCFNFLSNFLSEVKRVVKDDEEAVYVFEYEPNKRKRLGDRQINHRIDNSIKVLPNLI